MSRKRPADTALSSHSISPADDPLAKMLAVLDETVVHRNALRQEGEHLREIVRVANQLHELLEKERSQIAERLRGAQSESDHLRALNEARLALTRPPERECSSSSNLSFYGVEQGVLETPQFPAARTSAQVAALAAAMASQPPAGSGAFPHHTGHAVPTAPTAAVGTMLHMAQTTPSLYASNGITAGGAVPGAAAAAAAALPNPTVSAMLSASHAVAAAGGLPNANSSEMSVAAAARAQDRLRAEVSLALSDAESAKRDETGDRQG